MRSARSVRKASRESYSGRRCRRVWQHAGMVLVSAIAFCLMSAMPALAQSAWRLVPLANTTATPGGTQSYLVQLTNTGDTNADGTTGDPIRLTVTLPPGITAQDVTLLGIPFLQAAALGWTCTGDGGGMVTGSSVVTCSMPDVIGVFANDHGSVFEDIGFPSVVVLTTNVTPSAEGTETATFQVSGGGAVAPATSAATTRITASPPNFGIAAFDGVNSVNAAGDPDTRAGGHPYASDVSFNFNTTLNNDAFKGYPFPPSDPIASIWPVEPTKDVFIDLPPGFVGDPTGVAQCTALQLGHGVLGQSQPLCPPTSQVGTALIYANNLSGFGPAVFGPIPIYNLVPTPGSPASFGLNVEGTVVRLEVSVRSGSDYGLSVDLKNLSEALPISGSSVRFWGVPSDPVHDPDRACPGVVAPWEGGGTCASGAPRAAFLRNPTSCTAPGVGLPTTVHVDSWFQPGDFKDATFSTHDAPGYPFPPAQQGAQVGISGCDKVPFDPSLKAVPTTSQAGTPTGFTLDVDLPQTDSPDVTAESDLKKAVVTLPVGVRVSPSSADGLGACSEAQIALQNGSDPTCPDSSKLGSFTIDSPLLKDQLTGSIYLGTPHANPFGSLIAIYLVAKASGVTIKVPGEARLDPVTGQITTIFDSNPQLPFSSVHLRFDTGPRAALVTPAACGTYTIDSRLTSFSGKTVDLKNTFDITQNSGGSACAPSGFAPGFVAGAQNPVAGGFSSFSLRLTRTDDDGELGALSSLSLPPGLLANVSSITTRCTIEQADAHACPTDSHIGEVTTGAGAGPNPFYVNGDVYLTGPYKGNPFGIAVIVHAQAGPFDLGYVVVKGAIQIHDDGSVTVATDPFPTILQGIPLQIRDVRVNLDRPGFTFNPTSCEPMDINGTVLSTANQQAGVSSRFQVGECANLAFKPKFSASTAGKTSKANGASFHVHLASSEGPHNAGGAGESNIAKVDVQLPVALPARLTTLQKACTAAQFASNPAGCPAASFVGSATAHTPILASPLSGPAILVSHGGQAFPDLVLVLQGEGVRLNLTGHTQIKKGITYSHFETVPDAPVASFDLTLPQGPHSALTTDIPGRNLCTNTRTVTVTKRITRRVHGHNRKVTVKAKKAIAASLPMPTTITAQNGAVLKQATKIAVTGCTTTRTKAKKATKKSRRR
jgi:hypothetical protein